MPKKELDPKIESIKSQYKSLKERRLLLNWEELAEIINYDRTYISRVMNGHENLTEELESAIQQAFKNLTNNVPPISAKTPAEVQALTFSKGELIKLFRDIADTADQKIEAERRKSEEARKETEKILKENNAYLQDLVKSNLTQIEKWSFATLVDVQANTRYQAEKEADGDAAQTNRILAKQGKIAGVIRDRLKPKGKSTAQSKKNKD